MKFFKSLRFIIFGSGLPWIAFHSAEEAQEYWANQIDTIDKSNGRAKFFHFSGDETEEGDGLVPISQAYPEILEARDPRKKK